MKEPSALVLVPLVVTIVVLTCLVASTVVTVRRERRLNAVFAARWAGTLRRRRNASVPSLPGSSRPPVPAAPTVKPAPPVLKPAPAIPAVRAVPSPRAAA